MGANARALRYARAMAESPHVTPPGTPERPRCPVPRWWRRAGAAAFLFFLIKGLLWLALPALAAMGLFSR